MIKHLFKLIWNKKKKNFLLLCEMFVSFLVMFAVFSLVTNYYRSYKAPMGFAYEDVWVVNFENHIEFSRADSAELYYENLLKTVVSMPRVQQASYTGDNLPFANSTSNTDFTYEGRHISAVNFYQAGASYKDVLAMQLLEGRWFEEKDRSVGSIPVVINESLRSELAGKGKAVGKIIDRSDAGEKMQVIGVVADMKDKGDFYLAGKGIYQHLDSNFYKRVNSLVLRVTPDADAAFESSLYKMLTGYMQDASVEIEHLTDKRKSMNSSTLIPVIVFLTIAGFLIINVALGLFGVLWYNINQRKAEIGLRRAIGASGAAVSGQVVAEAMVLATLSLILGVFFAVQFPLLNVFDLSAGVYITAIFLAILFIYLLVLVCSLYPGKQAAAIYPAVALHDE